MPYLAALALAFFVALALTPAAKRMAHQWGIVAIPGGRRKHKGNIPKLGGIAVFCGYMAGIMLIYTLLPPSDATSWQQLIFPTEHNDALRLRGVILGTIVVFIGGLMDDKFDLPFTGQLAFQIVGAIIAIWHVVFLEFFSNPFTGEPFQLARPLVWLVTLVWIVGNMNAVNWLDGLDGLASGVGAIAALVFAGHAYSLEQLTVAAIPIALAGALCGFLLFNFFPASIHLGSAGVYVLGYNLATLAILSPAKTATALLVLALPLLDGLFQIVNRIQHGRSPFKGDRGHLHFLLFDKGWHTRRIVLSYYAVALTFGSVALFAPNGMVKFVVLLALTVAILAFLIYARRL